MKRFEFYLPQELFERIKLMAKFYSLPVSKMMIRLLEIGYIRNLGGDVEWRKKDIFILKKNYIKY